MSQEAVIAYFSMHQLRDAFMMDCAFRDDEGKYLEYLKELEKPRTGEEPQWCEIDREAFTLWESF